MKIIEPVMMGCHIQHSYRSVVGFIAATNMDQINVWGTNVEIYALAHLLQTPIFIYECKWIRYSPQAFEHTFGDSVQKAMYLNNPPNHFEVVQYV